MLFETLSDRDEALRFDLFFDDGPFGMILADQNFVITRINRKMKNMIRLPITGVIGRDFFGLLDQESSESLKAKLSNPNFESTAGNITLGFRLKDQTTWKVDGFIRRYPKNNNLYFYCILLFEQETDQKSDETDLQLLRHKIIVETQEEERMTIGSALHDNVAQLLYGVRLNLQYHILQHGDRERFKNVKLMLNEAIQQIRNISMELYPSTLTEFGLAQSIRAMANRFSLPDFQIIVMVQSFLDHLPGNMQLAIYRIVQELLNNAMKHAAADRVLIRVTERKGKIYIQVTDNGKGFEKDVSSCVANGIGIRNIRTRIKLFQGLMRIRTNQSKIQGTTVSIYLNLPE